MSDPIVSRAVAAVAATGLPSRHEAVTTVPVALEGALLAALSEQRLTGLASVALAAGTLEFTDDAHDELRARHVDQLMLDLLLEDLLVDVCLVLDQHGIPYRALKGPVLAHTVYSDPALRSFGDIDILVPPSRFDDTVAALRRLGFERRFIEPRAGFDARFTKGACLRHSDGREVDLHRTLAPGAFGVRVAQYDLFARPAQSLELGGAAVAGLDPSLAFVHACFHAALGDMPPRLVPIRDVAECSRYAELDDQFVIQMATDAHCEIVLQRAVRLVESTLLVRLEGAVASWARAFSPNAFDRWALRSYTAPKRSYSRQLAASFCALPTLRERASYAMALAFPTKSYVRAREGGYAARLTHGARLVRDGVRQ